jgi:hypothetical protein
VVVVVLDLLEVVLVEAAFLVELEVLELDPHAATHSASTTVSAVSTAGLGTRFASFMSFMVLSGVWVDPWISRRTAS